MHSSLNLLAPPVLQPCPHALFPDPSSSCVCVCLHLSPSLSYTTLPLPSVSSFAVICLVRGAAAALENACPSLCSVQVPSLCCRCLSLLWPHFSIFPPPYPAKFPFLLFLHIHILHAHSIGLILGHGSFSVPCPALPPHTFTLCKSSMYAQENYITD